MNTALIRKVNVARVFHAIREHAGLSQRRLLDATGLDRATISSVIQILEAAGWVTRSKGEPTRRVGRPTDMLYINSSAGMFLGIALEINNIRLMVAGLDGVPRAHLTIHSSLDLSRAFRQIKRGVQNILTESGIDPKLIRQVGIGLPALIDNSGHIMFAPNLKWTDLRWTDLAIVPELQSVVPAPVHIENDANAAALAEQRFGVCRGISDFILIHGHSGIGGSLYFSDELYRGSGGVAGELGHMKVVPNGRPCSCGGRGCLEAYVSERAICARLLELGRNVKDVSDIVEAANRGDEIVLNVLHEAGRHLGFALANIINLVNVHFIVLGGDLASLAEYLLPSLRKSLSDNVLAVIGSEVKFLVSALGRDAVAFGGIALAMDGFLPLLPNDIIWRSSSTDRANRQNLRIAFEQKN